jgi:hypothetical protein
VALHFQLKVNFDVIDGFYAQRLDKGIPKDGIARYKVTVDSIGTTVIRHQYRDGPWALVIRALKALGIDPEEIPEEGQ